jgi:hypothetical protein
MQSDIRGRGTWGNLTVPENTPLSTHETLVSLGVVVLQTDLQLDGLDEVSLLAGEGTIFVLLLVSLQGGLEQDGSDAGSHA